MSYRLNVRLDECCIRLALAFTICLFASHLRADDPAAAEKKEAAKSQSLSDKLSTPASYAFQRTELSEVAGFLGQRHGINIILDKFALEKASIDPDTPITFNATDVMIQTALDSMLRPLGLDWMLVNDDVIMITTADKAGITFDVRIYPVQDLVALGFGEPKSGEASRSTLRDAIIATIAPGTWKQFNGDGTISWYGDELVVRQTHSVHRQIEDLLTDMKAAFANGPARRSKPFEARVDDVLKSLTSLQFTNVTLREALDYISQLHRVTIVCDEATMRMVNIDLDEQQVYVNFNGITLRTALNLILEPMKLGWTVEGGVLKITAASEADKSTLTRLYFVKDLVSDKVTPSQLATVISDGIGADVWITGDGDGSIAALPNCLVIKQSYRRHQEIAALLAKLAEHAQKSGK